MTDRIINASCIELMSQLDNDSVPLIIADPPYGVGYHSNYYKDRNPHAPITGDWDFEIREFLQESHRVLVDGGALYMFCRWDVTPLWIPLLKPSGLKLKTIIIWLKDNWSAGDLKGSFGNQYEQLMFIVKGRHLLRGKRWSNVWEFPRIPHTKLLHPTQKPVELIQRAIVASSDVGDLVVDPFAGAGTTGIACRETNRHYILGDVDPRMIAVAMRRLGYDVSEDRQELPEIPPYELPSKSNGWGVHPEELQTIVDMLNGNMKWIDTP